MLTPEQRRANARKGGQARAQQFTRESQQAARAHVAKSSLRANGRKGWTASMRKVGDTATLIEAIAEKGRKRPSGLERTVAHWLDEAGISYAAQVVEGRWIVDFVVGRVAIECDGHVWHTDGDWQGYGRTDRARRKDAYLKALGYKVVRLSEKQIKNGRAKKGLLRMVKDKA